MMMRRLLPLIMVFFLTGCFELGVQAPAPVVTYGQSSGVGSAGVHNVRAGDTLYSVASAYRLPMRDIVALNRIKAPFSLREGQRLKLPPPQDYRTQAGDTLYDVSRLFGVKASEVARLNKIGPPYSLREGQVLRLPFQTRMAQREKAVKAKSLASVRPPGLPVRKNTALIAERLDPPSAAKAPETKTISRVSASVPKRAAGGKFLRPVAGEILSGFGPKSSGQHNDGINIAAAKGTSVVAAENGVVVYAGNELKGMGNLILIRHEDQWITAYGHLDAMHVRKGEVVRRGQSIGTVGNTGSVEKPQLHFEIRRGTEAINPAKHVEGV